jgi:hypothetical protein
MTGEETLALRNVSAVLLSQAESLPPHSIWRQRLAELGQSLDELVETSRLLAPQLEPQGARGLSER